MPQGLQVWNGSGQLVVDLSTRLTRILGWNAYSAGASGTVTDAGFALGTPFAYCARWNPGLPNFMNNTMVPPTISFSGTTMTYNLASPSGDHLIVWGTY